MNILNFIRKRICCDIVPKYINKVSFCHPVGVVFYPETCGEGCMVWQNVTVGLKDRFINGAPRIGNDVTIYAGAIIIGSIKIGDGDIIGAGAIVLKDVPERATIKRVWK